MKKSNFFQSQPQSPTSPKKDKLPDKKESDTNLSGKNKSAAPTATTLFERVPDLRRDQEGWVYCKMEGESALLEDTSIYFGLNYRELDPKDYKAVILFMEFDKDQKGKLHFKVRVHDEYKNIVPFEKIAQKAKEIGLPPNKRHVGSLTIYYYQGDIEKIEQLFPVLRDGFMKDRYCSYQNKRDALYNVFIDLYQKIQQNFTAQYISSTTRSAS